MTELMTRTATDRAFTVALTPGTNIINEATNQLHAVRMELTMQQLRNMVGRTFKIDRIREDISDAAKPVELDIVEVI